MFYSLRSEAPASQLQSLGFEVYWVGVALLGGGFSCSSNP